MSGETRVGTATDEIGHYEGTRRSQKLSEQECPGDAAGGFWGRQFVYKGNPYTTVVVASVRVEVTRCASTTIVTKRCYNKCVDTRWTSLYHTFVIRGAQNLSLEKTMKKRPYKLEGKDVPASLRGQVVNITIPETLADAKVIADDDDDNIVAGFTDSAVIRLQGQLRTASKKKSLAELQALCDGFRYTQRGEGTPREVKPKTVQTRTAASAGNKMFEYCLTNEKELERLVRIGLVDRAEFDAWKAAREVAAAPTPAAQ